KPNLPLADNGDDVDARLAGIDIQRVAVLIHWERQQIRERLNEMSLTFQFLTLTFEFCNHAGDF
ncbi:MAG TPA: hypothetical protein VHT52_04745, partial [Stellaceae bacterium]|nr:hypothetical protein [Stellaceae bacterium]